MTARTALRLARSSAPGEARRRALVAGSVAVAGALLIHAIHLLRATFGWDDADLAPYVLEDGTRGGVVIGTLLLVVPVLALSVQALRTGSTAREHRMSALRLAGVTPGEQRAVAAVEAGRAAAFGALLAAPVYLGLWIAGGVLPPVGARLVDQPDALDAVGWLVLVPGLALAGTLAGAVFQARGVVSPRPGKLSVAVLAAGVALVVGSVRLAQSSGSDTDVHLLLAVLGLLIAAFAGGPWLVLGCARLLARRADAESLLAARRLRADPRGAGRIAAVLVVCGAALSIDASMFQFWIEDSSDDMAYYLGGFALAAGAMLVAVAVALLGLLLGTADGLLAARRPLAALAVFGLDERGLARVLRRQLLATAAPAFTVGALLGYGALLVIAAGADSEVIPYIGRAFLTGAGVAVVAWLAFALVTRAAVRVLRPLIRAAIDPENLRAA
ncbi:hypothetical protein C8N24_6333 [Solirubrobacter pauli]|uniref:FtsX-like permease family protein n=1 Tax=Solirubrobacter pauli TaxID=166793 RepID=A0A660L2Q8_9ACTN|nr:hypothetical protein [Solirubrobacter pauli]RKQ88291.1 hypothetical protein C8N24_6333 [Solirubrobacter pauli]